MSKITLANLANLQNEATAVSVINSNNAIIQAAWDDNLSRDGLAPNQFASQLDMNSNRIINLPAPVANSEPLRLQDLILFTGGGVVSGIPAGGAQGSFLIKNTATNYDIGWETGLTWDNTNKRLGIGTTTPGVPFQISQTGVGNIVASFNATTGGALISINNTVAGQQSGFGLSDGGVQKWQFLKQTDNTFLIFDNTNAFTMATFTPGTTSTGKVTFNNTTASTTSATGAVVISGGLGIVGSVNVGTGSSARLSVGNNTAGLTAFQATGVANANLYIDFNGSGANYIDGNGFNIRSTSGTTTWGSFTAGTLTLSGAGASSFDQVILSNDLVHSYQFGMGGSTSAQPDKFFIFSSAGPGFVLTADNTGKFSFLANVSSSSTTTGTVVVTGGLGISGAFNAGANSTISGSSSAQLTMVIGGVNTSALYGDATQTIIGSVTSIPLRLIYGNTTAAQINASGTQSTTTATGTLVVTGGMACSLSCFIGNNINVAGSSTLNNLVGVGTSPIASSNLVIVASSTTVAQINLPSGTAPTSPNTGDIYNTASGIISNSGLLVRSTTQGVGYATGSGGTVTQATSRTTGVTLNRPSGQMTMFSAAGSATAASFTFTNSTVAATDVIHLSQAGGTNLYNLLVTNVASGSFQVTFFTTGGTATDAPTINFTVIKGVTS